MSDINNCQDYVYTFFDNELFHFSPAVITFLESGLFVAIIGGIIWFVCEVFLPHTADKVKYFMSLVAITIPTLLLTVSMVLSMYKSAIVSRQYDEIVKENIADIQNNMYLVRNDTRDTSRVNSPKVSDDTNGRYEYTVYIKKDNQYYSVKLRGVETNIVFDEGIQGIKYEISTENDICMTKYVGSNT
jgi:hypothetical protein